ncbi:Vasodilator-stimulated phosphoprotein [Paragonimus heterotremus]|uniref:Vasodilator-stimulated phosphoprotein n=1 Tax=Paragonimus heterotremus TaxID=100268 RepID=A0A8J4T9G8_9TREM|nr:Vasodilator-stimulated phosphoprotein [Paragonimus heterotremus]
MHLLVNSDDGRIQKRLLKLEDRFHTGHLVEECPVVTAKANVMLYDTAASAWVPSGARHGISKVQLYHNTTTNAYRVVGWRLQDREVVINCAIVRGLKYHRARQTFHQWRDSKQQVYGLNFATVEEADVFAAAVEDALANLTALHKQQTQQQQQQQSMSSNISQQQQAQMSLTVGNRAQTVTGHDPNMVALNRELACKSPVHESHESLRAGNAGSFSVPNMSTANNTASNSRTGTYVDMSQVNIVPPSDGPSSAYHQHMVTAEYAYPSQAVTDVVRSGAETASSTGVFARTDFGCTNTNVPVSNGTTSGLNGSGSGNHNTVDACYYSSSDDSVKGLIVPPMTGGAPSQFYSSPADGRSVDGSNSPAPSNAVISNRNVSGITAPANIPPPPPLPPPLSALSGGSGGSNNSSTRASRPLHRSSGAQPCVSDAGDDEVDDSGANDSSFACQLRLVKQQRLRAASLAGLGSENQHPPGSAATVGRATGLDMMSDLQRVLAARRRAKEAEENGISDNVGNDAGGDSPHFGGSSTRLGSTGVAQGQPSSGTGGNSSIVPGFATLRKNSSPALDSNGFGQLLANGPMNVNSAAGSGLASLVSRADLEAFKRELMSEFRREVQQLKNDVIEALRSCANRS